jgi:hypothetical protein
VKIPCETIVRMSHLLPSPTAEVEPIFRTLRLDNGKIIATDRRFMAIEQIEPFEGVYHISVPDALLAACQSEAQYSGVLTVTPMPGMPFITAVTTMGFNGGNIGVFPSGPTDYDKWHEMVVAPCASPVAAPQGGMLWQLDDMVRLAACAPSGVVIFEGMIDAINRPTVVRDVNSPDWCGFFLPRISNGIFHAPATVPGWLK